MSLGLSAADFNYEERLSGGQVNTEEDILAGLYLSFKENSARLYGEMIFNYFKGSVDYTGQAQDNLGNFSGVVSTNTDAELLDVNYWLGGQLNNYIELYAGIGYRYWRREINSSILSDSTPVAGLLE